MKKNTIVICNNCNKLNDKEKFYCSICGFKLHEPHWTTSLYVGTERGKRTDIEFRTSSMEESIQKMKGS